MKGFRKGGVGGRERERGRARERESEGEGEREREMKVRKKITKKIDFALNKVLLFEYLIDRLTH